MRFLLIALLSSSCLVSLRPQDDGHRTLVLDAPSGPFTRLHHGPDVRVPYLWPVIGPNGTELTRAYPVAPAREGEAEDHPHHTSLWLAHGDVNGHDFWHSKGRTPRIDVAEAPVVEVEDGVTTVRMEALWDAGEEGPLVRESRRMVLSEDERVRRIDLDVTLEALADVTFGDTKEGTFALRLNPALRLSGEVARGHAADSEGREDGELWGERSRWLTYHGAVGDEEVGVAVLDHPANLRHPTWWHAREYGLVAANPFGAHDFDGEPEGTGDFALDEGETLRMRYRVLLYAGAPDLEALEAEWRAYGAASDGAEEKGEPDDSSGRD